MNPGLGQHFPSDEYQYRGKAGIEETEIRQGPSQKKIKCPQPQNGADVRGVHDEWIARDSKNRRNGIHRKNQIADFNNEQRQEERCNHPAPALFDKKSLLLLLLRDGKNSARPAQNGILLGVKIVLAPPK